MLELKAQTLFVRGEINFDNAQQYYQQGLAMIREHKVWPLALNLAELERPSTISLAVLIAWLRQVPKIEDLHFEAVPEKMLKILQTTDLKQRLVIQA